MRTITLHRSYRALAVLLLLTFAGCDSAEDDPVDVAGTYTTIFFVAEIDGQTVDVLGAGGFIEMTLRADGTVAGQFFVPAPLAEGDEIDASFGGTYSVSGTEVTFDHEADTFIRDVPWTFDDGTLRTETDELSVTLSRD